MRRDRRGLLENFNLAHYPTPPTLSKSREPVYDFGAFQTPIAILKEPYMLRISILTASLILAVVLVGCSKTETNDNKAAGRPANSTSSTPATTAASSSGDKI